MLDPTFHGPAIAADLSPAQQRAVLLMDDQGWIRVNGREFMPATMRALRNKHLVRFQRQETEWQLNPLGMAARAALEPHKAAILGWQ